jgi:hypothetical protein
MLKLFRDRARGAIRNVAYNLCMLFIALSSLLGADGFVEIHGIVNSEHGERLKGAHFLVIDNKNFI